MYLQHKCMHIMHSDGQILTFSPVILLLTVALSSVEFSVVIRTVQQHTIFFRTEVSDICVVENDGYTQPEAAMGIPE